MRTLTSMFALLLATSTFATRAQAQSQWFDGGFDFAPGLACITWNPETAVTSYAGYWGTMDTSFPRTGDISYVHAVSAVVGNPCAGGEVIDFNFQLPPGAELAISAQNPVVCQSTRLSDGTVVTSDPNIHCLQTPGAGTYGGLDFGYAIVPSGWAFEIRVPVQLNRALLGMAGPATDKLKVGVNTSSDYRVVEAWVTAPYRALVNYPAPSAQHLTSGTIYANAYRLTASVFNFYKAGLVEFEMGSDPGVYNPPAGDGVIYSYSLPDTSSSYEVWTDVQFDSSGYTGNVYWRARYTPSGGATYYGPEQHFVANGGNPAAYALTVSKSGAGAGSVTSDPVGLSCGATCSQSYTAGTLVTLAAAADPGSTFAGWSGGGCSGTGNCAISMSAAQSVTATFAIAATPMWGSLDVTVDGLPAGNIGTVEVTGPGGYTQTFSLMSGTGQSLSDVTPGQYVGVAADVTVGSDTYIANPRTISTGVLGGGRGVIAAQYALGRVLAVNADPLGAGTGSIVSSPSGIDCGASCSAHFADGAVVTLTAVPDIGFTIAGWSVPGCLGTNTCEVTMTADQVVTATFGGAPAGTSPLVVTMSGTGTGNVTSAPAGIDCGAVCNANFADGTTVTLTATPNADSEFAGWSGGGCSGTGTCIVTVNALTTVNAELNLPGTGGTTTPHKRKSDGGCNQSGSTLGGLLGLLGAMALLGRRRKAA